MGCHFLLQGIFSTQGWKPCLPSLLHWQVDSLPLSHLESLRNLVRFRFKIFLHQMEVNFSRSIRIGIECRNLMTYMPACSIVSNSLRPHGLYSPPGSSVHGILWAEILEWVAIFSSMGSPQPRDRTHVSWVSRSSCIGRWILYH